MMQNGDGAAGKGALLDRLLQNGKGFAEALILRGEVSLGQERRALGRWRQDFGEWLSTLIAKCGGGSKKRNSAGERSRTRWGALSGPSVGLYNFTSLIWMAGSTSVYFGMSAMISCT